MPVWLNTTLLGLGTVFVGLICLIYITRLMSALIGSGKKKQEPALEPAASVPAPQTAEAIPDRAAFVAAVSAAIATTIGTDVSGLRIHSIQKIQ